MTLKDSTDSEEYDVKRHIQGCLMTNDGACDGNIESHDGVVRLYRMRIRSNRYDPTTWAKESKTGYYLGKFLMKIKHESNTAEN